jgi:hypothetical protein
MNVCHIEEHILELVILLPRGLGFLLLRAFSYFILLYCKLETQKHKIFTNFIVLLVKLANQYIRFLVGLTIFSLLKGIKTDLLHLEDIKILFKHRCLGASRYWYVCLVRKLESCLYYLLFNLLLLLWVLKLWRYLYIIMFTLLRIRFIDHLIRKGSIKFSLAKFKKLSNKLFYGMEVRLPRIVCKWLKIYDLYLSFLVFVKKWKWSYYICLSMEMFANHLNH